MKVSDIAEKQVLESKLILGFYYENSGEDVKNVFINTTIPDMFQFEKKVCSRLDCRKHYTQEGFSRVAINYSSEKGLHIIASKGMDLTNRQELFIPERYIICVGVDYESEQPE
jgi:hypothetical protein